MAKFQFRTINGAMVIQNKRQSGTFVIGINTKRFVVLAFWGVSLIFCSLCSGLRNVINALGPSDYSSYLETLVRRVVSND